MSITRTLGGNRLGSGKRQKVEMKSYERSTHDLSYIWRSTMASGTLVPFMTELGLPGDTFDINLDVNVMTHPTVGPLFGSYKVQLDVFMSPVRLYQAQLHNNKLGIGLDMEKIKLPQLRVIGFNPDPDRDPDNQQINPSSLLSYLNIRGVGRSTTTNTPFRWFNALPYLSYWDIYKNYYANKQEEIGAMIHQVITASPETVDTVEVTDLGGILIDTLPESPATNPIFISDLANTLMEVHYTGAEPIPSAIILKTDSGEYLLNEVFMSIVADGTRLNCSMPVIGGVWESWRYASATDTVDDTPKVVTFPLENIDQMRENILAAVGDPDAFEITNATIAPYGLPLYFTGSTYPNYRFSCMSNMEGLALKTYQSDLFNNWMQTEWLDGTNGINEITSIDTTGGSFSIDTLNLSKKVYDMLNRIALSGGSYDDWLDTVYTHERYRSPESPIYMGGLSKELVFQEVVSTAEAGGDNSQPLGTLAGKGRLTDKHKGGKIVVKVDEPCYIMGIISLTPRVDYSQGNKWDVNLKTMDDFHKPALDEIGFQDLITDQMAWWDTPLDADNIPAYKSAGKQPAWINYMTNVNQVRGNFAVAGNEMFMTLNRKYEYSESLGIQDLTTYIDPAKFNEIFAQTARDTQNFWTQIGVDITARRKMSAKVIPNL